MEGSGIKSVHPGHTLTAEERAAHLKFIRKEGKGRFSEDVMAGWSDRKVQAMADGYANPLRAAAEATGSKGV